MEKLKGKAKLVYDIIQEGGIAMIKSISHVGLFVSKLLGAIFGALMVTFLFGEAGGSFADLAGTEMLLVFFGGVMAVGFLGALFKPLMGGSLAVAAILGINSVALLQRDVHFEFDFPLQLVLGLSLIGFSLALKRRES